MAVFSYDSSGGAEWKKSLPIYSAGANIAAGAFLVKGSADGTNTGFAIPAPVNTSQVGLFIGILAQAWPGATLDNDPNAGTKYILADCIVGPHHVYRAKFDNTYASSAWTNGQTMTTCASTSIVVTSGENLSGGWLFTDAGYLHYVLASSSGTYTLKSAVKSAETTANKVAKLSWVGNPKITIWTGYTDISIATPAAGAVQMNVLDMFIKAVGFDYVALDPTKHDGLYLPMTGSVVPAVWADLKPTQHYMMTNA